MAEFAIGQYGSNDFRLVRWDGSTQTDVGSAWDNEPRLRDCSEALLDYHGMGSQPFSSREGTIDLLDLGNQWRLPVRDMTIPDETMPWDDQS